jgi:hypothetical protein
MPAVTDTNRRFVIQVLLVLTAICQVYFVIENQKSLEEALQKSIFRAFGERKCLISLGCSSRKMSYADCP